VEEVVGRRVYAAEGIGGEATRGGGARRRSRSPVSGLGTSGEGEEWGDPRFADNRPRPVLWGLVGGCALLSQWVDREVLPVRVGGVALLNLARLPYSRVDQASHPFIVSVSPRQFVEAPLVQPKGNAVLIPQPSSGYVLSSTPRRVAVTRHKPETLPATPGRVIFSA
jgi:hypothetical protein